MEKNYKKNGEYFEFSLYAKNDFFSYYQNVCDSIKKTFSSDTTKFFFTQFENQYVFAIDKDYEKNLKEILVKEICKYITSIKKNEYFENNIDNLYLLAKLKDIFLKILTLFDKEQDILEITKNLRLDGKLYLDEFCSFKLKNLKNKWQEICQMVNENSFFFSSGDLVFELLRFLLSSVKPEKDILFIEIKNEKIFLLDREKNIIFVAELNENNIYNLALNILDNYASRIYISANDILLKQEDKKVFDILQCIFKRNLKILE